MMNLFNQNAEYLYINEPIDKITNDIIKINNNIVLTGPVNSGKTLVIKNLIKENKMRNIEYIFFNNCPTSFAMTDFDEQELIHIIELNVFNYAYKYLFSDKARKDFRSIINYVDKQFKTFEDYYNKKSLTDIDIDFFKYGELSMQAIAILESEGKKVNIIFDRFEAIDKSIVQQILIKYTNIFDQGIIVVDNDTIKGYESKFESLGYDIVKVDYSKNYEFMRHYINKLVCLYYNEKKKTDGANSGGDYSLPATVNFSDFLGEKNLRKIIERSNGDIDFTIRIVDVMNKMIEGYGYNTVESMTEMKSEDVNQLIFAQEASQALTKKMYPKKTIYLDK